MTCAVSRSVCVWRRGGGRGYVPEDVPLVEFMYLVFTRIPGESYSRWLRPLLLCCVTSFVR